MHVFGGGEGSPASPDPMAITVADTALVQAVERAAERYAVIKSKLLPRDVQPECGVKSAD
jgi:hypothetical protein